MLAILSLSSHMRTVSPLELVKFYAILIDIYWKLSYNYDIHIIQKVHYDFS